MVNIEQQDGPAGPWQKTPLYAKLEDTSIALAKLYSQGDQDQKVKTSIYKHISKKNVPGAKVYEERPNEKSKIPSTESNISNSMHKKSSSSPKVPCY